MLRWIYIAANVFLSALVVLPSIAQAQITKTPKGYLLRARYTPGAVLKYLIKTSTTMPDEEGKPKCLVLDVPMVLRIKAVSKGVATIETTLSPPSRMTGSQAKPMVTEMRMDALMKPLDGSSGPGFGPIRLPEKPLKLGDKWSAEVKSSIGPTSGMAVTANFKLLGLKTLAGKQVAEIQSSTNLGSTAQGMTMKGNGKIYLLVSDGSIQLIDMVQTITMTGGPNGKPATATSVVKIVRQS